MKKWLLLLIGILCFASIAWAGFGYKVQMAGPVPEEEPSGTPTIIAEQTAVSPDSAIGLNSYTVGNSFTVSAVDPFYSLSVRLSTATTGTVTCRVGTSNNLSTYSEEITHSYNGTAGLKEILSTSNFNLTTGTMYFACQSTSAISIQRQLDPNNTYSGGGYCYASGASWDLDCTTYATSRDTTFQIKALQ